MGNYVVLENGIKYEFTADEMKVLQIALLDFNTASLPLCSEKREEQYLDALKNLQNVFLNQFQRDLIDARKQRAV